MRKNLPVTQVGLAIGEGTIILSTTDPKGKITYVNQDFVDISGFASEELLGQPHNIIRHPDMPRAAFQDLWTTLKAGRSWIGMVKNRCKNGDHYWVSAFATPITENGKLIEYQSVRLKPERDAIQRAERVYRRLNETGKAFRFPMPALSLATRLLLAIGAVHAAAAYLATTRAAIPWSSSLPLLAGTLAASCLAILLLTAPLRQLVARARRTHESALAQYIYTGRHDDLGQIALALEMTDTRLQAVVGRLQDSAGRVTDLAERTARVVGQSSSSVATLKRDTDSVAEAMQQMSITVKEVAASTVQAANAASDAGSAATEGRSVVGRVKQASDVLANEVSTAADLVQQLENESANIEMVVRVIHDLAKETNLLALNATIEASHAGDLGRGFKVVASNIRSLAAETHDSAQEIERIVRALQEKARAASGTMLEGRKRARSMVEEAQQAAVALDVIDRTVGKIREMNTQVASAAEEQSAVSNEISENVSSIAQQGGDVANGAHEVARTSDSMAGLASSLHALVAQFR